MKDSCTETGLLTPERPTFPDPAALLRSSEFLWATGIEDTFITAPWPPNGRTLDEYELTGHYRHWEADLALTAQLGVRATRYGVPWHRINPAPGEWNWEPADGPLNRLRTSSAVREGFGPIGRTLVHERRGVPHQV